MRFAATIAAVGAIAVMGTAGTLEAQETHVGAHLSYGLEDWSDLGVGVQGTHLFTPDVAGAAAFTYYFNGIDGLSFWELNFNGHYRLAVEGDFTPYVGGGVNYSRFSYSESDGFFGELSASDSEVGLNLLGGAFMDLANSMRLFGEARFILSDADQLVLTAGAAVPIG